MPGYAPWRQRLRCRMGGGAVVIMNLLTRVRRVRHTRREVLLVMLTITTTIFLGPTSPADAADPPPCGAVLVAGSSWLGGAGVDVYSNGTKQTTGYACDL